MHEADAQGRWMRTRLQGGRWGRIGRDILAKVAHLYTSQLSFNVTSTSLVKTLSRQSAVSDLLALLDEAAQNEVRLLSKHVRQPLVPDLLCIFVQMSRQCKSLGRGHGDARTLSSSRIGNCRAQITLPYVSLLTMAGLRNSGYSEDHFNRERPLVVKCTFYDKKRRITFNEAKNCSSDILRQKVK